MDVKNDAIRLIDKLYRDLYFSEDVLHHGNGNKYDKFENIKRYIDKLEKVHNWVAERDEYRDYLKQLYYDKYVIKREDIPESYYRHQQDIAMDRGYGYVEITGEEKNELQNEIIRNQQTSLDRWLDYFLSDDAKIYPFWAKYWAFQGMLRLGNYDKEKGEFGRRTKNTVAPFADLNREALAISIDMITKSLNKKEFENQELNLLVKSGSFQKIYSYVLTRVLRDNKNITKRNVGKWVKYNRGTDHMVLVKSLQGYNTGWCTAGEETARAQLSAGDFYVYYTLDENDEYKVPRIAIRMEGNKIGEIRGVAESQNLEPEMETVVAEKIKDFPDKDEYYKKVHDMERLTHIYKKYQEDEELTKEELRFIYEVDDMIIGFGYDEDPRIFDIIEDRIDNRRDLALIFDCREEQIALKKDEINDDTVCLWGQFVSFDYELQNFKFPKYVLGNVNLDNLQSASGVVFPEFIRGSLSVKKLMSVDGLVLPKIVKGSLDLDGVKRAKNVKLPDEVGGSLWLCHLLVQEGLVLPKKIGDWLHLGDLQSANGLVFPETINGCLALDSLVNSEGVTLPRYIGENLFMNSVSSLDGLKLPEKINGDCYLRGLESVKGLVLPKNIKGSLDLSGLKSARELTLPDDLGGDLLMNGLINAEGLIFPKEMGGDLFIDSLVSIDNLKLPENIRGRLFLNGRFVTPEEIEEIRQRKKK